MNTGIWRIIPRRGVGAVGGGCVCVCTLRRACLALIPPVAEELGGARLGAREGLWVSRPPQSPSLALGPRGHEYISIHLRPHHLGS